MIGNDVVDLEQALLDGRYDRPRFLEKAFNNTEKNQILDDRDPHKMGCVYWSAKESAYKAFVRETANQFLNPKRVNLHLKKKNTESILMHATIDSFTYSIDINVDQSKVLAIATKTDHVYENLFNQTLQHKGNQYAEQHVYIHEAVLCFLSNNLGKPKSWLSIKKDLLGIPFLYINNVKREHLISLTHHGEYAAYLITV